MLETFNSNLKVRIEKEVFRQTSELRNSSNGGGVQGDANVEMLDIKQEFTSELKKKASKAHLDNCMNFIKLVHN